MIPFYYGSGTVIINYGSGSAKVKTATVPRVSVPQYLLERIPILIPHSCHRWPGLPSQFHSNLWYPRLFPLRLLKSLKKNVLDTNFCGSCKKITRGKKDRKKKWGLNNLGCGGGRVRLGSLGNREMRTWSRPLFNHRPRQPAASGWSISEVVLQMGQGRNSFRSCRNSFHSCRNSFHSCRDTVRLITSSRDSCWSRSDWPVGRIGGHPHAAGQSWWLSWRAGFGLDQFSRVPFPHADAYLKKGACEATTTLCCLPVECYSFAYILCRVSVLGIANRMFRGLPDPNPSLFSLRCWADWNNSCKIKF
jgi:hypothetical protein